MDQQQHAEVATSRKKGVWLVARSIAGCVLDRVILNLQRAASPLHREEEPISVPKSYKRGRFASSDIGICGDVRSAPNSKCRGRTSVRLRPPGSVFPGRPLFFALAGLPRFLQLGPPEFDDGAGSLSSWHSPGNANLPIGGVNNTIKLFSTF